MKRVFEIEFPDELGEMWMNQDNLMLCINAYCDNKDGRIKATDVTDSVVYLSKDQSLPCQYGKVAYERLKAVLLDHKIDVSLLDSAVGEAQVDNESPV